MLVVPPYPYSIEEDRHDVDLEDCWTARPQLFFSCHLRPKGGRNVDVWTWMWMFGRGKPRLGGLTIEETSDRQDSARKASDKRRKETRDGRKDDGA